MPDGTACTEHQSPATPEPRREPTIWDPEVERLDEAKCWRLISAGGVGRLAYSGRSGLAVLPVGYQVQEGSLLFRIALGSPTDEDLRTGIEGAEYKVAVEIDDVGTDAQDGPPEFHTASGCWSHVRFHGRPAPHTTRRCLDLSGLSKPQVRADRQINAGQNPRAPTQARQPCRAFWRGSFLFTTNVRPRRRTTIEPGRTFSPRSEFLTFMI